ncbi:MAG: DHA2 family efflux MFS transporter permease subunit, partial [Gammaproteobacteria bacterium]|nr:DHA2 family efflux MFS transporter permease subunit [Gammaproteobacteria bacterium]
LLWNIAGFLIASMLCGVSTSITEIVAFRVLQGVFGAALVPISQFVLRDTFPRNEQSLAMAIWGMGIMVAPVLGPTLGGYITETLNWRFVFYINLPVCVVAFILAIVFIKETPAENMRIDWWGLLFMAVGVGCFQTFLDRGNQAGWFDSNSIILLLFISVIALYVFITRGWNKADNVINLKLFKERNFTVSTLLLSVFCLAMFGVATLQPIMLGTLYHYPSMMTGIVMAPRGIASAVGMMFCPLLMKRFSARTLAIAGLLFCAYGTLQMCYFSLDDSTWVQIYPGIIQGIGMGLVLAPVSTCAFDYLEFKDVAEAAGLYSFGRSMGTSIGISIMITIVSRLTQINWNRFSGYIRPDNPYYQQWLHQSGLQANDPTAIQRIADVVSAQSSMVAFVDAYWFAVFIFLAMIVLAFFLKKTKNTGQPSIAH